MATITKTGGTVILTHQAIVQSDAVVGTELDVDAFMWTFAVIGEEIVTLVNGVLGIQTNGGNVDG